MLSTPDLFHMAAKYHRALPDRVRRYLSTRGIPGYVVDRRIIGWNGTRITIPVFNRKGVCASVRLAKDPDNKINSPKMLSSPGSSAELYGWEVVRLRPKQLIICEGEFDRLVLEARGFDAVTSTGGAGTFQKEWADAMAEIPEVYICFDLDDAGRKGALRVGRMVPHARIVELPESVGRGGDVTDFFVRLRNSNDDFIDLLARATPVPSKESHPVSQTPEQHVSRLRADVERIKCTTSIVDIVGQYVPLQPSGARCVGRCPFHEDRNPSFTVYPAQGTFHCFGCGAHGDVVSFVQRIKNLTFRQALDLLEHQTSHDPDRRAA